MSYPSIFSYSLTVPQSAIDEYGHVNNVVYLQWMQDAAIRHGNTIDYKVPDNTGWFAREHHIQYLSPAFLGEELEVRTWLSEIKRVRLRRKYEFIRKSDGKVIVKGETDWVYVDIKTGRPITIPTDLQELFPVLADQRDTSASFLSVLEPTTKAHRHRVLFPRVFRILYQGLSFAHPGTHGSRPVYPAGTM